MKLFPLFRLQFEGEFSEQYLVQVWQNLFHPSLSTEPWTTEEDQQLYDLASQHRLRDWSTIAHELQVSTQNIISFM